MSPAAPILNTGDTAWMLTASLLVLMMSLPGLALFYGGLVRAKNVLSVLMQCVAIVSLVSVLWVAYGYSLAFSTQGMVAGEINWHSFFGGFDRAFLQRPDPRQPHAHRARIGVRDVPAHLRDRSPRR